MALLVILTIMGVGYTLLSDTPKPVRQLELTAVWGTLALIAVALLSNVNPGISLPIAAFVAAPLWYLTITISEQQTQSERRDSLILWKRWQASTGARSPDALENARRQSLASRLNNIGHGDILEEIEITQVPAPMPPTGTAPAAELASQTALELAPMEASSYRRRRLL